ncbi:MAG: hypothetical protein F6K47_32825 [Symploca sp. SIO2E6]|nr:hypothetical protein [Symploca sp. SIO2E6]
MPRAVILTALPVEYLAVRTHLRGLQERKHPQGNIYEEGKFLTNGQEWEVGIAKVGAGNPSAAAETERAIAYFQPSILLFVGIAGGIKDVAIGDVVVATHVYSYESGKVEKGFSTRPKSEKSAYGLVQRADFEVTTKEWLQRLSSKPMPEPRVFVAPIVAGEKVLASKDSEIFQLLRKSYNDAIAVEMEGYGFLRAAFAYDNVQAIVIRGISDLIEGKNDGAIEPEEVRHKKASLHASAFAFQVLSKLHVSESLSATNSSPANSQSSQDELDMDTEEATAPEYAPNDSNTTSENNSELMNNNTIYVERPPIEANCYRTIMQPGALLRVKAPQMMGKTRLMYRVLDYAKEQGYETVDLSFELADSRVFQDLEKFCKWFCVFVGNELEMSNMLDDYWQDISTCNHNTTNYFRKYLLAEITQPLVLALDKVDLVFENAAICTDFCRLLRNWHDRSKRGDRYSRIWQKLRLLIVHDTDFYATLDLNSSPLASVGMPITLPEFNAKQLQDLAQQHGLTWNTAYVERLMGLVGGHPYLVESAFERIKHRDITLTQLLQNAHTAAGIYSNHLRQHLGYLQRHPELARGFRKVVTNEGSVKLDSVLTFKLQSMGLIELDGDTAKPRCELYRKYFRSRLSGYY